MKGFVVVVLVLFVGIALSEENEKRGVLKRVTRQAMNGMGAIFLKQTEENIIKNCKKNGLSDEDGTHLQNTYDEMMKCVTATRIFSIPKNEFIDKIVNCSKDAVTETKKCLPSDQKYFPDFVLDLMKSLVSFMYDDRNILADYEIPICISKFQLPAVQKSYIDCMIKTSMDTNDTDEIPRSKAEFCAKFLPAGDCFPKTLLQYCDNNSKVLKFTSDYSKAMEQPCERKEQ